MQKRSKSAGVPIHALAGIRPVLRRGFRLGLRRVKARKSIPLARKTPPVRAIVELHPIDGEDIAALVSRE